MLRRLCIFFAACISLSATFANEPLRPVNSAWMLGAGSSHLADTYLSPVKYGGTAFSLTYSRLQAMRQRPLCLAQGLEFTLEFERAKNPAGNATMLAAGIAARWNFWWRRNLGHGLSIGAGGSIDVEVGAVALMRNGNNPVQAEAAASVGPQIYGRWTSRLGRMPLALTWQLWTPLAGAFFCPDYGELYYEISIGNRSGLVHFGWPANRRQLRSLLSADLALGNASLRLAYRFNALSANANNITARRIAHEAVVGIVCDYVSINPRKPLKDAQIITAYY